MIGMAEGCARAPGGHAAAAPPRSVTSDRDDRYRSQCGIGLDLARGSVAVHDRQSDVHQNEIGPLLRDRC
jgi:hypothetical protein